jgi:DNA polymerase-1
LAGDQSDDIPGVGGIGQKTASRLIKSFGEVNNIYLNLDKVKTDFGDTVAKKLVEDQEAAQMSKKLATIDTEVPIKLDWEQTEIHEYEKEKALELFEELEFRSLSQKLPNDKYEQEVQEALF